MFLDLFDFWTHVDTLRTVYYGVTDAFNRVSLEELLYFLDNIINVMILFDLQAAPFSIKSIDSLSS